MKQRTRWLALGFATALVLVAAGSSATYAQVGPTAGQFAFLVANQGNPNPPVTTDEAIKQLRRLGVVINNPADPLTEEMLARIMRAFGFRTTSDDPGGAVDFGLANAALGVMSTSALNGGSSHSGPFSRPLDVGVCLSAFNTGQCIVCCRSQGSPASVCAQFCNPPVSPSTP